MKIEKGHSTLAQSNRSMRALWKLLACIYCFAGITFMGKPSRKRQKVQSPQKITLFRLLSTQNTGDAVTVEGALHFVKAHGLQPKDPDATHNVVDHILSGSNEDFASQFISTSYSAICVAKLAKAATEGNPQAKAETLYVATIEIEANRNDHYNLSSFTDPESISHRSQTCVDADFRANQLATSMKECIINRSIEPSEIVSVTQVSEFVVTIDEAQPTQEAAPVLLNALPPLSSTRFHDRPTEVVENNVKLLRELFSRTDIAGKGTHFAGLYKDLTSVMNGLKDGKPTDESLTFIQANIHQSFFDLFCEDGFDIRNCTPDELNEFSNKLPDGWSIVTEEALNAEEDEVNEVSWYCPNYTTN